MTQAHALDLAKSLILTLLLIQGDETTASWLADDHDGEPVRIVHEYDPFDLELQD